MENIGNSGVSGNRITSKYTFLGNSPEFRVVLEPWERILTASREDEWIKQMGGNESLERGEVACELLWAEGKAHAYNAVPSLRQRGRDLFIFKRFRKY